MHAAAGSLSSTAARPASLGGDPQRLGNLYRATALYAVTYRPVLVLKEPRVEVWPEVLTLGEGLPVLPSWLGPDLCVPVRLEESYLNTCRSLRILARNERGACHA